MTKLEAEERARLFWPDGPIAVERTGRIWMVGHSKPGVGHLLWHTLDENGHVQCPRNDEHAACYEAEAGPPIELDGAHFRTDEALAVAIRQLSGIRNREVEAAVERLRAIRAQRGCEHFDAGCTDGRLATLIDIVIDG